MNDNQNKKLEINITDISDMGQGIGRVDGQVIFVENALPGDFTEIEITQKKNNFSKGRAVKIIEPSSHRTEPICPLAKQCGGCAYMSLNYEKQLQIKEQHLKDKLERIGGISEPNCEPIIAMENPLYYRNKTEFAVSKDGTVGFNRQGSHQIIDIPKCYISSPVANTILEYLRANIKGNNLKINKVTVRTSFSTGETMVIIKTDIHDSDKLIPMIEGMDDAINEMPSGDYVEPSLESLYVLNQKKKKDVYTHIAGKKTIMDEMMGLKFEISPQSFYQTNPVQTEKLFKKVADYVAASGKEKIFDLYCGVGSIGLTLAGSVKEVWGVESVKDAVLNANRNAVINGIINAQYLHGKAEEMMDQLSIDKDSVILLDPPRAGCKPEVLEAIGSSKAERIVYVSCDPATLARDTKILSGMGFSSEKITPVDMFPQTVHVETVVLMSRKEK